MKQDSEIKARRQQVGGELAPAEARPAVLTLDDLFRRYARYVGAIGLRLLGRHDEVDDLVQDVFVAASRSLHQLQDPKAAKAWLITITVRKAHKRLQKRRLWAFVRLDTVDSRESLADPAAPPDQRALLAEVYARLDRLPAKVRIAWVLRHIQGERLETVAAICGCSLATAKRRIAAAGAAVRGEDEDDDDA